MTRYCISDLHLDHENIIKYCDRPFDSVDDMNEALVENWNRVVESEDTVLYLGDFGWWDVENVREWYSKLNGEMVLVRGNHDEFDSGDVPFPVVESCTISHDEKEFYCEHHPIEVPDEANWWHIHGHHHNNFPDEYPLFDPETRRLNISCELLEYTPTPLSTLCSIVDEGSEVASITEF